MINLLTNHIDKILPRCILHTLACRKWAWLAKYSQKKSAIYTKHPSRAIPVARAILGEARA